jgi:hypothetical protein
MAFPRTQQAVAAAGPVPSGPPLPAPSVRDPRLSG